MNNKVQQMLTIPVTRTNNRTTLGMPWLSKVACLAGNWTAFISGRENAE